MWEVEVNANPKSATVQGRQLYWFDAANELWAGQVPTGTHAFSSAENSPPGASAAPAAAKHSLRDSVPGEQTAADLVHMNLAKLHNVLYLQRRR